MSINLYDYIIIRENFIPDEICSILLDCSNGDLKPAEVIQPGQQITNTEYRLTNVHKLSDIIIDNLSNTLNMIHESVIKSKYNSTLKLIEPPQLLSYDEGYYYNEHNDCEDYVDNVLTKVVDRDITIIFYLNDNYTGGELEFTNLGLTYKPKKNSMIIFPSYYEFSHRVHPVRSGKRVNLVCWLATKERIYERAQL